MADSRAVDAAQAAGFDVTSGVVGEELSPGRLSRLQRIVEGNGGKLAFRDTGAKAGLTLFDGVAGKEIFIEALEVGEDGNDFDITLVLPVDDNAPHALAITDTSAAVAATATLNPTGADNSLLFTAKEAGAAGNSISVAYVLPTDTNVAVPLAISVTGTAITVSLEVDTDGSTVITTGTLLVAAFNDPEAVGYSAEADALVTCEASGTITGLLAAVAHTHLTGGADNSRSASVSLQVDTDGSTVLTTAAALVTAINADNSMNDIVVASAGTGARESLGRCTFEDIAQANDDLIFTSKVAAGAFSVEMREPRPNTNESSSAVEVHVENSNQIVITVPATKTVANVKTAVEAHTAANDLVTVTTAGTTTHAVDLSAGMQSHQGSRANRGSTILTAATVESATGGVDSEMQLVIEPSAV